MRAPFVRLVHLGNVVVDLVLTIPALPDRGGDLLATTTLVTAGGGFNVIAAAARQGLAVTYGGAHGTGPFGDIARAALLDVGADVVQPFVAGRDTGFVVCLVDAGGERTFLTSPGAETTLNSVDLARLSITADDAVHLSGYSLLHHGAGSALASWLSTVPDAVTVSFDPGPLIGTVPLALLDLVLPRVDWFTCSADEAEQLTGVGEPEEAVRLLTARTGRRGVLLRAGATGCLLGASGRPTVGVPGFGVAAVDTNGAGDAHTGIFLAMLARGLEPVGAATAANAGAALAVTRRGPATAPTRSELARLLSTAAVTDVPNGP